MKRLLLLASLLPAALYAQSHCESKVPIGAGITGGFSSRNSAVGEMYIAVKPSKHLVIYPVSIKVHSKMSDPTMPVIFEPRVGLKLSSWEFYGGYGYHFAGQDGKEQYKKYQGFKPGFGIIYHAFKNIIVTGGLSGKVASFQIGFFNSK